MQQHPIPQNVTGFEFKLVGFLTLKQFLYLAAAGIIDFILFVAVGSIIKWFVMIPLTLLALALAFFPVGGMPFDKWIVVFIKAITSPSRRIWFKEEKVLSFLEPHFDYYLRRPKSQQVVEPVGRGKLDDYLAQIRAEKKDKFDRLENTKLASLHFDSEPNQNRLAEHQSENPEKLTKLSYSGLAGLREEQS